VIRTIPAAPAATRTDPLHGHAQRAAEGRSRDALARAIKVARAGGKVVNMDRRLYGGIGTIGEVLASMGLA